MPDVKEVFFVAALLLLSINFLHVESKLHNRKSPKNGVEVAVKRAIDPLTVIGAVVKVATTIYSAVCKTKTDICG